MLNLDIFVCCILLYGYQLARQRLGTFWRGTSRRHADDESVAGPNRIISRQMLSTLVNGDLLELSWHAEKTATGTRRKRNERESCRRQVSLNLAENDFGIPGTPGELARPQTFGWVANKPLC